MTNITVIILTKNEELHIARAITSVAGIAHDVIVVDSGSTDRTVALAQAAGARVLHHPWVNYASQFNWALAQVRDADQWILRLDADEYVTEAFRRAVARGLPDVAGLYIGRRMCFQGAPIRYGGLFPRPMLRLFRLGKGQVENRWMDEHITVTGPTATLDAEIIDDNRKPLDWWIAKHNHYASREVIDLLNRTYGLWKSDDTVLWGNPSLQRWLKTRAYGICPAGLRAGLYFAYRYILRGGIFDGPRARAFHVLQGFWYRYLVDQKYAEARRLIETEGAAPDAAIKQLFGIDITPHVNHERDAA